VSEIVAEAAAQQQLQADAELARLRAEVVGLRSKYKAALAQMDRERERADSLASLRGVQPVALPKSGRQKRQRHQATAVLMLSDVHAEERVLPETVNGENDYSLDV